MLCLCISEMLVQRQFGYCWRIQVTAVFFAISWAKVDWRVVVSGRSLSQSSSRHQYMLTMGFGQANRPGQAGAASRKVFPYRIVPVYRRGTTSIIAWQVRLANQIDIDS